MHGTYILNAFPPKDLPDEPSPAVDLRPAASYLSSYAPGPPYWGSLGARSELFIPLLTGPTATMSHLPRGSAPGTPPRVLAFIDHVSPSMSPPLRPLPSPLKVWDTSEAPLPFSPPAVAEGGKGWTRRASLVPQSGELSTFLPSSSPSDVATGAGNRPSPKPRRVAVRVLSCVTPITASATVITLALPYQEPATATNAPATETPSSLPQPRRRLLFPLRSPPSPPPLEKLFPPSALFQEFENPKSAKRPRRCATCTAADVPPEWITVPIQARKHSAFRGTE